MITKEDPYSNQSLEPYYSELFINFINKTYGFNWKYQCPKKEADSADAFAITERGALGLQLTLAEGGQFKARAQEKVFEYRPNEDWKRWIRNAVKLKEEVHYSDEAKIILLIQGYSPVPKKEEVEKYFKDEFVNKFIGIYYVVPEQTVYPNGYVAIIKDAIGGEGELNSNSVCREFRRTGTDGS